MFSLDQLNLFGGKIRNESFYKKDGVFPGVSDSRILYSQLS